MQTIDGRPVYAATDLVAYLACEHLTQLERAALAGLVKRPMRADPELDIIRKRGFEHEKRYLADLTAAGRSAVTIALDGSIEDRGDQLRAVHRQRGIEDGRTLRPISSVFERRHYDASILASSGITSAG